jgi:hypothetical protein
MPGGGRGRSGQDQGQGIFDPSQQRGGGGGGGERIDGIISFAAALTCNTSDKLLHILPFQYL